MPAIGSPSNRRRVASRVPLLFQAAGARRDLICRRARRARSPSPTRTSATNAGLRNTSSRRASRQKRNEWSRCACTAKRHVVERAEVMEQGGDLERACEPEPTPAIDGKPCDVSAVEMDAAFLRGDFAAEQAKERTFAGSIRTDHRMDFIRRNVERDRICWNHTAKAFDQAFCLQERSSHDLPSQRHAHRWRPGNRHDVVDAAMNGEIFLTYLRTMSGALSPGEIVTMINLPAHKFAGVRATIKAAGAVPPALTYRSQPHRAVLRKTQSTFAKGR